jgi:chromosome segregation ATPase
LHGISDSEQQKLTRILAETENKQLAFKQRKEMLSKNTALKTQIDQLNKKISKLSTDKQERDETIEQMKGKMSKVEEQNYALRLELLELDHNLEMERTHLNETKMSLNETQMTLEETKSELHETQGILQETVEHLQQEQKLRLDLIEDYKHLEDRLRDGQNRRRAMEASLRRQLGQLQEEFEQTKRSHRSAMEKCQSEKRTLQEQINTYRKRQSELEEVLKRERERYNADMKVMQDRLTKCTDENTGYKKVVELTNVEKASMMAEQKRLLGKFEADLDDLDMYTERLKPDRCPNPGQCLACKLGLEGRCTIKNVEYELKCALCSWTYNGETRRPIRERIGEHGRAAQNKDTRNPVGSHFANKHGGSQMPALPFAVQITRRAVGNVDR